MNTVVGFIVGLFQAALSLLGLGQHNIALPQEPQTVRMAQPAVQQSNVQVKNPIASAGGCPPNDVLSVVPGNYVLTISVDGRGTSNSVPLTLTSQ